MKKLLILNHGLHISGVSKSLIHFANAMHEQGYKIHIKLHTYNLNLLSQLSPSVKVTMFIPFFSSKKIFYGQRRIYSYLLKIFNNLPPKIQYLLIKEKGVDYEIAYNRGLSAKIIANSWSKRSKKLVWVHTDLTKATDALAGFKNIEEAKINYSKFDRIIAVGRGCKENFIKKLGVNANYKIAYNIIDQTALFRNAEEFTVPKEEDKIVFLAVCRLSKEKNIKFLLGLFNRLRSKQLNLILWIVGDGPEYQNLINHKNELNLNNVIFWGAKANPYPYFKAADIYISSSLYEGMPTSLREAQLFNLPILTTEYCGAEEIIGNPPAGEIIEMDVDKFEKTIIQIVNNPEVLIRYKKNATINSENHKTTKTIKMNLDALD